ncbi:IS5 family transposase [Streptomyces sp. FIT100]|nr:IS5 family transposase [Streptomyces sp. FIT100]
MSKRLVPDELWELAAPLLPSFAARPQGGGTAPCDERAVFTAVVYVLTSGCAWRHLPPTFGTSPATAHRRFTVWTEAGLWRRLHRAVLDELGALGEVDWTLAIVDAASVPREKEGSLTGPNPVDRGKQGSKLHVLSDAQGIPLAVAVSGANMHDSLALKPLIRGIPSVRSRRGPRRRRPVKLRADKAYFSAEHLAWLRERGLVARIAPRPGIESGERLGRHRWKIERSIAWPFGYRRLTVRYERKGSHFLAFPGLAAALTCYKKLAKLTT